MGVPQAYHYSIFQKCKSHSCDSIFQRHYLNDGMLCVPEAMHESVP